jgi:predicted dehydrogenase
VISSRKQPLRLGLIGAGAIAQTYFQSLPATPEVSLEAVVDIRPEAADAAAEAFKCRAFASYKELAAAEICDAVVICTPPDTHPDIAAWFLERGVHVLCEKPLAMSLHHAHTMFDAAEASDALLTMASKFRFVDDIVKAKSLIDSGLIGDVIQFENAFTTRVDMHRRWNADPIVSGGGVLIDNGTHSVDIMRYFLGPLKEIQVIEGKRVQQIPVEDTVRLYARSAAGVMGNVDLSWSINKELPHYVSIYGAEGTIIVGWKESRYRRATDKEWTVFGRGYDKVQAFASQLRNFTAAVRGEERLRVTLRDALASVEVIDKAYQSMQQDRWLAVDTQLSDLVEV